MPEIFSFLYVNIFFHFQFVCIGGTAKRMKDCAHFILNELGLAPPNGSTELQDLTAHGHRYSMFKAGCVLCVNVIILLHILWILYFVNASTNIGIFVPRLCRCHQLIVFLWKYEMKLIFLIPTFNLKIYSSFYFPITTITFFCVLSLS